METPVAPAVTFESFNLRSEVLTVLKELGYEEPTPIQRETIPALISGRDVLGQAATGTGKTAAFALPMLERMKREDRRPFEVQGLVLVPTRELAMQVAEAIQKYGAGIGVTSLAVYGGQEIFNQIKPLKRGVDIIVATPGRALDHIARKSLLLNKVKFVVLDEADEMLDMGFEEDLQSILKELPKERQTALFSATLAPRIAKIAEKHLRDPVRVAIASRSSEAGTLPNIRQSAYVVQRKTKEAALMRVLEWETPQSAIIFCRTRNEVEALTHVLMRSGYEPASLHGGLTQEQRDAVLKRFKDGSVRVLVATDVAARGLHVEALSHVINFDLPTSPEVYVHRIGRTGRAGKDGVAISFVDQRETRLLGNIERLLKKKIVLAKVPSREDLDARRATTVATAVKAAMEDSAIEGFKNLVNEAADGSSLETVAAAAMMLLQQKMFPKNENDSVDMSSGSSDRRSSSSGGEKSYGRDRGDRPERSERSSGPREDRGGPRPERPERGGGKPFASRAGTTGLTISLGAKAGIRPQDLVGAIANEAGIPSKQINGVRVDEMSSRLEVPHEVVEQVIEALHATKIRGRKVHVMREKFGGEFARPGTGPAAAPSDRPASRFAAKAEDAGDDEEAPAAPKAARASAPRAARASAPKAPRASAPKASAVSRFGGVRGGEAAPSRFAPEKKFGSAAPVKRFGDSAGPKRFGGESSGPKRFGGEAAGPSRFGGGAGGKTHGRMAPRTKK